MNIWSLIIFGALFILPSLLPSKKNAGKKAVHSAPVPKVDKSLEEVFGMEELEEPVSKETLESQEWASGFSETEDEIVVEDDLGQPVFSYETFGKGKESKQQKAADNVEEKEVAFQPNEVDSMSVTTLGETFDLRKAIIYQTIMQRVSA